MPMDTFERLLESLAEAKIEFLLVGGIAVDLCGFYRSTEDVDIIVRRDPQNVARLIECLLFFGEGAAKELTYDDFAYDEGCVRVIEEFPLDIFTVMGGHRYEDLLRYKQLHTTPRGAVIPYLDGDGLILLKSSSVRPKDRIDVEALQALKKNAGQ